MRIVYFCTLIGLSGIISSCSSPGKVDFLILGGSIVDGTGAEIFVGNIGITSDTISYIGSGTPNADLVVDAEGMIVSPGFIDPHTHSLGDLLSDERNHNLNYLTQGVTTVFNGNDGGGPFNLAETESKLSGRIGTNTAFFVGHGTVRLEVLGKEDVQPDSSELAQMKRLINQAMSEGALGLSTGLYYVPGSYATTEEVIELTKEIVPFGGVYDSHIRDESTYTIGLIASVKEVLEIGEKSGAAVHFAHIKALGVDVWGKSTEIIELIEDAQKNGLTVTADQYPWSASGTRLQNVLINSWVKSGSDELYYQRLNDPKLLPRIREEVKENIRKRGGAASLLITGGYTDDSIKGMNLKEIAEKWNIGEIDAALVICRNGGARIASFNMNEADIRNFMVQDWVMTSSDGSTGHPRKYASYPRKYQKYVKKDSILTLVDFIQKSTSLVAKTFGIERRGTLEVGSFADIIVFDPDSVEAVADFNDAEKLSKGMSYVLVNGKFAINDGRYTGVLNGKVLKKAASKSSL